MKFTEYSATMRRRADRAFIQLDWIQRVIDHPFREHPVREIVQSDRRIRRWAPVQEMEGRHLRVILLPDAITAHNVFLDRTFGP